MSEPRKSGIDILQKIFQATPQYPKALGYGIAVLSVMAATIVLLWMHTNFVFVAPLVSVFLCAVILSSWFGGPGPGLLAVGLSSLALDYFFLSPLYSFTLAPAALLRLSFFMLPALFIVCSGVSQRRTTRLLRRSHNILEESLQKLSGANRNLHEEIAERKHAQEQLHTREQEFRAIVENTPDHIIRYDREFHRIYVNPAVVKTYGMPVASMVGKAIGSIVRETGLDMEETEMDLIRNRVSAVFDTGESNQCEMNWPSPAGRRYYSVGFFPERDTSGTVIYVLGIARDITERKHAEEALRQSEDRIRLIIDTIPIMAWSMGPDSSLDFANQRWLDYAGLSLEEELKEPTLIIHPEDRAGAIEDWNANRANGKPYETEMRLRRHDGEYRWFLVRTAPLHDEQGNLVKWYGVSIDIEDSKRAESLLKESELRLRQIAENIREVFWIATPAMDELLYVSPAYQNVWGRSLDSLYGKPQSFFEAIHPDDCEYASHILKEKRDREFDIEYRITRPDGSVRWIRDRGFPVKDESGKIYRVAGVAEDITERKTSEKTLQKSYEEIRLLTEHLQNAREDERKHIAREIHDELGQQLTAIKMDVAWIDKKTPAETVEIKSKLKNIIALLDGSNLSVRKILSELRPKILDDNDLLEAVRWLGTELSKTTGIHVAFTTTGKDGKIGEQAATCIFRVCQEAFTNIARHSNATHVLQSINIGEVNITLIVEDNGTGFDTTSVYSKRSFGILGMKERIGSLGGEFELVSSPGNGTRIKVSIPYKEQK